MSVPLGLGNGAKMTTSRDPKSIMNSYQILIKF